MKKICIAKYIYTVHPHLSEPLCASKKYFCSDKKFRYVKYIEKYYRGFYYNMNIIKMYMNNVIILILAVRICEDSDTRGSDKRGYTVSANTILS